MLWLTISICFYGCSFACLSMNLNDRTQSLQLRNLLVLSILHWKTKLGIPDYIFYTSTQLKVRTLTGLEKLNVLSSIDIRSLLPSFPNSESDRIQTLWTELLHINQVLSKPEDELSSADIAVKAWDWVRKFISVYQTKNVTPYIHEPCQWKYMDVSFPSHNKDSKNITIVWRRIV